MARGAPAPQVNADRFSARWTRTERLAEGTYRFTATVDDGIRVWVNGVRILDDWQVAGARTVSVDIYLTAGSYETRVEYFEADGLAAVALERTLVGGAVTPPVSEPTGTVSSDPTDWRGAYYNNRTLSGTPDLVRTDNNIDFNWGSGSPAPAIIAPDSFSVRWTRTLELDPGRYRFAVTADDGVRLFLDNRLLIDEWHDQAATTYIVEAEITSGTTNVRLDYYENRDQATIRFSYAEVLSEDSPTSVVPAGAAQAANWRGEYFDNVNLSGEPRFVRTDSAIAFDWGTGSPAPNVLGVDRFSVRWSDTLTLTPGRYRFVTVTDDGVRLRINGEIVIDHYTVQSARNYAVERDLPDGRAQVVMEYFEDTGQAVAQLYWQRVDGEGSTAINPSNSTQDEMGTPAARITGAANLNMRSGPGVQYAVVTVLAQDQSVSLIGRNRTTSWIQIQLADGRTGWVNRRYLNSDAAFRTLPITG
ncbi:MAG: PA14 domain-containing protein [Caldilineaceae bacterium]